MDQALARSQACLPLVVVSEVRSDPNLPRALQELLLKIPTLELTPGYWERAGRLRARLIAAGHKARLADTLIAQSCLDHEVPLVTRDRDIKRFVAAGLRLLTA